MTASLCLSGCVVKTQPLRMKNQRINITKKCIEIGVYLRINLWYSYF